MRNIKAVIEYDGTRYSGMNVKKKKTASIECKVEAVLCRQLEEEAKVLCAVATEAGVHARGQVIQFQTQSSMPCGLIKKNLNEYLPKDIRVISVTEEEPRFHAVFQKKKVSYEYRINIGETADVFGLAYQHRQEEPLDIEKMQEVAAVLTGTHDLSPFVSNKKMKKSAIRTIEEISIKREGDLLLIVAVIDDVWPDLILYMTGILLLAGEGKLLKEEVKRRMEEGVQGSLCLIKAEAKGLSLLKVYYGEEGVSGE